MKREPPGQDAGTRADAEVDAAIRAIYSATIQEALPKRLQDMVVQLQARGTKPATPGYPCCRLETSCPSSSS